MNFPEITQDDLYDLGFEPVILDNAKSIDYEHKELDIKLWKGMFNPDPNSRFWKMGYGKEKVQFESLEQLKEYMAAKAAENAE
jgi:hypothetical protein